MIRTVIGAAHRNIVTTIQEAPTNPPVPGIHPAGIGIIFALTPIATTTIMTGTQASHRTTNPMAIRFNLATAAATKTVSINRTLANRGTPSPINRTHPGMMALGETSDLLKIPDNLPSFLPPLPHQDRFRRPHTPGKPKVVPQTRTLDPLINLAVTQPTSKAGRRQSPRLRFRPGRHKSRPRPSRTKTCQSTAEPDPIASR